MKHVPPLRTTPALRRSDLTATLRDLADTLDAEPTDAAALKLLHMIKSTRQNLLASILYDAVQGGDARETLSDFGLTAAVPAPTKSIIIMGAAEGSAETHPGRPLLHPTMPGDTIVGARDGERMIQAMAGNTQRREREAAGLPVNSDGSIPTPPEPTIDPRKDCPFWGEMPPDQGGHSDCDVILHDAASTVSHRHKAGPFPQVCTCECLTCKRAWFAAGRPILRDGKLLRDSK